MPIAIPFCNMNSGGIVRSLEGHLKHGNKSMGIS